MGKETMKFEVNHNRETNVAYVDVSPLPAGGRVDVIDVTEQLGLKSQVLARVDENGELLGVIIEDYSAFRREVQMKYLTLAVERFLDLIVAKVKLVTCARAEEEHHRLPAAAHA